MAPTDAQTPRPQARNAPPLARAAGWRRTALEWSPWRDRAGRLSPLRAACFAVSILPGLWLALALGGVFGPAALGAEPIHQAEHLTGLWAVRFLLASLALTPLRLITGWGRLAQVRRLIGLTAFAYAAVHFGLYIVEQQYHLLRVASEIVQRLYLAIGFTALLALGALSATSFDRAIRRMGANWRRLHRLSYVIALLALAHFALQEKLDVAEPAFLFGLFAALMLHRLFDGRGFPELRILGVAILAAALTAGVEWTWYQLLTGLPADRILAANLDLAARRPAVLVLVATALPVVVPLARRALALARPAPAAPEARDPVA
ncbi:ferric reductase-like transmembrane domain-containing protein [Albimonas sp. CAU 1670]|uniref:sulfite oxidase heme-binding subunit YedZ n=1 Tax=Albimonas sp. CAU 1670 TaxID=3032599 RepID=UPI0023DAC678|nr:ferric reductase-like transmembrane domain-containing protein [Albimonas sp. CAU 1670]MDF2232926.1 ferric reductase-like transmembrane domain-containing protein [Albimonas sp. CAU 1670]